MPITKVKKQQQQSEPKEWSGHLGHSQKVVYDSAKLMCRSILPVKAKPVKHWKFLHLIFAQFNSSMSQMSCQLTNAVFRRRWRTAKGARYDTFYIGCIPLSCFLFVIYLATESFSFSYVDTPQPVLSVSHVLISELETKLLLYSSGRKEGRRHTTQTTLKIQMSTKITSVYRVLF